VGPLLTFPHDGPPPMLSTELLLLSAYTAAGPLAWAGFGFLMYAGQRKMYLLKRPPKPLPPEFADDPPSVTIIVPAKDEGERIRACIESCLSQDYPRLDVVTIDDRSVDETGRVMDDIAAKWGGKHRVLHVQEGTLEPGWTGKNNAVYQGQKLATGDWLLFVDSDVVLEPDAVSASMSVVLNKKFDLLSLLPRLESHTFWETTLVPLAASAASTMYLVPLCNNNQMKRTAFANGQFLLIRRDVYDAMGTHAVVKDRYCEDVAIARLLKSSGYRPRVSWGNDWARVRMYSSLSAIFKGWSRIYYSAYVGRPWRTLVAAAFLIVCCFTAAPAVAWGVWRVAHPTASPWLTYGWLAAAVAHVGLMVKFLGDLYAWSGNPRRNALFFPVAGPMLLGIMVKALKMCVTKRVEWRGTSYGHTMASTLNAPVPGKG